LIWWLSSWFNNLIIQNFFSYFSNRAGQTTMFWRLHFKLVPYLDLTNQRWLQHIHAWKEISVRQNMQWHCICSKTSVPVPLSLTCSNPNHPELSLCWTGFEHLQSAMPRILSLLANLNIQGFKKEKSCRWHVKSGGPRNSPLQAFLMHVGTSISQHFVE